MLLEIELAGVKTPCITEGGELPGGEDRFQEFASREGKQLSDISCDRDTRLTNTEELVDEPSGSSRSVSVRQGCQAGFEECSDDRHTRLQRRWFQ